MFGETIETSFDFGVDLIPSDASPSLRFDCWIGERPRNWDGEPVYHSARSKEDSVIVLRVGDADETLSFRNVSDFRFCTGRIECVSRSRRFDYLVTIQFLGYVMSYWLERSQALALHGSAVSVNDEAIGFLAAKGTGKSTIAATLIQHGHGFITDDILALRTESGRVTASPAYPHLRIEPDGLEHFFDSESIRFPLVHPAFEKRRVPIRDLGGRIVEGSKPLRALVVLERSEDDQRGLGIDWLSPTDGLIELLRHSFLAEMLQHTSRRVDRLSRLADVTGSVPIARVSIPNSKTRISEVAAELLACLSIG